MEAAATARESRIRSVLKALTYRVTGTLTTMLLTFVVTGELAAAIAIGSIEPIVKIVVYYLHERAWQCLPIGSVRRLWSRTRPNGPRAYGDGSIRNSAPSSSSVSR